MLGLPLLLHQHRALDDVDLYPALELTLRIGQSELLGDAIAQDVVDPAGPESRRPRLQIAGLASRLVEGETMTVLLS